ncbi:contact-dependent growth inhibition system immunity protein, partial [Aquibium sp. A9E412]|uniref:contact-dependent growth inhibition system immunity protein n=1 Tax=Aquibium sp. A9E412 TaxID=2976767 RepID=UPI0025B0B778
RSLTALYKGVGGVSLTLRDGIIFIEADRYEGRGGFGGIKGAQPIELPETVSDAELGAAIRAAIAVSRAAGKR